jgi:hypothetical protein
MDSVQNRTLAYPEGCLSNVLTLILQKNSCCHSCVMYIYTPVSAIPTTFFAVFLLSDLTQCPGLDYIISVDILFFLNFDLLFLVFIYIYAL